MRRMLLAPVVIAAALAAAAPAASAAPGQDVQNGGQCKKSGTGSPGAGPATSNKNKFNFPKSGQFSDFSACGKG
jgi:hypothetical protein